MCGGPEASAGGHSGNRFSVQLTEPPAFFGGIGIVVVITLREEQIRLKCRKGNCQHAAKAIEHGKSIAVLMTIQKADGVHDTVHMDMAGIHMNAIHHLIFPEQLTGLKSQLQNVFKIQCAHLVIREGDEEVLQLDALCFAEGFLHHKHLTVSMIGINGIATAERSPEYIVENSVKGLSIGIVVAD